MGSGIFGERLSMSWTTEFSDVISEVTFRTFGDQLFDNFEISVRR
jgi:hypothetical protein